MIIVNQYIFDCGEICMFILQKQIMQYRMVYYFNIVESYYIIFFYSGFYKINKCIGKFSIILLGYNVYYIVYNWCNVYNNFVI